MYTTLVPLAASDWLALFWEAAAVGLLRSQTKACELVC